MKAQNVGVQKVHSIYVSISENELDQIKKDVDSETVSAETWALLAEFLNASKEDN